MIGNPDMLRNIRLWLAYADENLRLAVHAMNMSDGEPPYRLIAFQAQQCAEHCLKAFLAHEGVDFPATHDISLLLGLGMAIEPSLSDLEMAAILTPYAMDARYPSEDPEVGQEQAIQAIDIARQVRDYMTSLLQ